MANRTIFVTLRAHVGEYNTAFDQAAKKTRELGTESEKLAQKKQAFDLLGQGALAFGAAAAAGVTLAIAKFAEFDQQMSYVQAATNESASNMELLRAAALEAGASTVYSASEAAMAIEELAKAGVSTQDILNGGLDGALAAAASGGVAVATAAELMASTLSQFSLRGDEAAHVADLLAASAGKAQGGVEDIGQALNQAGLVANQFGLSVDETVGVLTAFANAGMLGSDAGTSLRTMLLRLANPTKEVVQLMEQTNIQAYDAQGNFVGLDKLAGNLETSLAGMTQAQRDQTLAMIFGQDAIRGANILLNEGEDGIRKWTDAVDDQGFAAETAAQRLDNLMGDLEALGGAFDTALIQSGSAGNDVLRVLIQTATEGVEAFTRLPEATQGVVLGITAVAGAVGLASGAYFLAIPRIAEYREALQTLGITAQRTNRLVGTTMRGLAVGAAIGLTVESVNMLLARFEATDEQLTNVVSTAKDADEILTTLSQGSFGVPGLDDTVVSFGEFQDKLDGIREVQGNWWARFLNSDTFSLTNDLERLGVTLGELATTDMPAAQNAFDLLAGKTDGSREQMLTLLDAMPEYKDALIAQATAAGTAADDETLLAMALGEGQFAFAEATEASKAQEESLAALSGAAAGAGESIEETADTIRGFAAVVYGSRDAAREFEASIDGVTDSIEENGRSLDITTEAGRANEEALDRLGQAALENAASIQLRTGSEDEARAALQRGREELIRQLEQFGITGDAAEAYADDLGLIPGNIDTVAQFLDDQAQQDADAFVNRNDGRKITLRGILGIETSQYGPFRDGYKLPTEISANGNMFAYASGGFASGIYSGRQGAIHKFAEPETRWEAYISGKPGMEQRNAGIAIEALGRLGYDSIPRESRMGAMSPVMVSSPVDNSMRVNMQVSSPDPYEAAQLAKLKLENAFASAGEVRR